MDTEREVIYKMVTDTVARLVTVIGLLIVVALLAVKGQRDMSLMLGGIFGGYLAPQAASAVGVKVPPGVAKIAPILFGAIGLSILT